MTPEEIRVVQLMTVVSFLPGSFDKRFYRDVRSYPDDRALTERQHDYLMKIFHRYRKQIHPVSHDLHCELCQKVKI